MKEYKLLIVGAGPAGISTLFYLDRENKLDNYIQSGICIIEKGEEIGAGKFKDYNIYANTVTTAFLEILYNKESINFQQLLNTRSYLNLKSKNSEKLVRLNEIGQLYSDYGEIIKQRIYEDNSRNSDVFCKSEVLSIRQYKNGYCVKYEDLTSTKEYEVFGENLIVNLGGNPRRNLTKGNIITADSILRKEIKEKISKLLDENRKLILLGNSHSAMSIASEIMSSQSLTQNHEVLVVGRKPIKLYYENEKQAMEDAYQYDIDLDVCKVTGRINRYSGMRGASFVTAKKIINSEMENITYQKVLDISSNYSRLDADVIIDCTGYQSKFIQILDLKGKPISLEYINGILTVNKTFNPMTVEGKALEKLYTYGLGTGILPRKEMGGEESFKGRVDGVWLYQHFVAPKIFSEIEKA